MNQTLIDAAETLAKKAASSNMGHEARSFAKAANQLVQAAVQLHYATQPPTDRISVSARLPVEGQ